MGDVVAVAFDRFRPAMMKLDAETSVLLKADAHVLAQIEVWARSRREILEHTAKPLHPAARFNALEALGKLYNHPAIK